MFMKNIRLPIYSSTAQCSRQFLHPLCLRLLQYSLAAQRACLRHVPTRNYILQFILCPITPSALCNVNFVRTIHFGMCPLTIAHICEHYALDLANEFKVDLNAFVCNTIRNLSLALSYNPFHN